MEFPLLSSPSATILLRGDTPTTVATTANLLIGQWPPKARGVSLSHFPKCSFAEAATDTRYPSCPFTTVLTLSPPIAFSTTLCASSTPIP